MFRYRKIETYQRLWRLKGFKQYATLPEHTLDCPECGQRVDMPRLSQGQECCCPRCGYRLARVEANPFLAPLCFAIGSLIIMAIVYTQMFITVEMPGVGVYSELSFPSMVKTLILQDFGVLAEVMFILTFGTPLLFLVLCTYVFTALHLQTHVPALLYATRTMVRLREWIMVDVFFISTLVAYIKLQSVALVTFGPSFWLMLIFAVLLIRTSVSVPQHWVYYQIHLLIGRSPIEQNSRHQICCSRCLYFRPESEHECGVCGTTLFSRRPKSLKISSAFLLAAMILYIPANTFPIMISSNPTALEISTIMSGIIYMWDDGDRLIAVIIFSASIAVPILKILSMSVLILSAHFGLPASINKMSLTYRITESIGRWSMIDIFVIIILMSAFHTPMARVLPGPAAIYFCLVVLLTMLSAHFFDSRLLWDKHHQSQTDLSKLKHAHE
ncbi:paraquat-inducible protein A [Neisseria sp. 83E34]|uniref:paraquat-inducible protein A n=1 Tax=Neisseria sp. 83E34 TaxID=1692264 RepID=UPI000AE4D6B3|nr:paraquat-inducible protein A [Neisseria sp. 83E34]